MKVSAERFEPVAAAQEASKLVEVPQREPILALENVTVDFDGFLALRGLDFSMERRELRFVIGPNGAGKTSLLDVITGKVRPVRGRVRFAGRELVGLTPHAIATLGIGRKFQTPSVFPAHTVMENMILAFSSGRSVLSTLFRPIRRTFREEIGEILELVGLSAETRLPAGLLSHGKRQWLEIAMLMTQEPELLLLDEPAAGMTGLERDSTVRLLESIAARRSVLVIEHDMEFVRRLARTVTVLHAGSVLCEGTMQEVSQNPTVIDVYLGRAHGFGDA
jgi:urea transport system ATP-binding protein